MYGADEAVLIFSSLHIHQSVGRPGVDAGVCWSQRAELVVEGASLTEFIRAWPFLIYDGESVVDGVTHRNGLPVPLRCGESFKIVLEGVDDENNLRRVDIEGRGATLTLLGGPGRLNEFKA